MAEINATDVARMEFQLALRRRGISDQAVLRAMDEVPREHFVIAELSDSAYADQALPIACGQTISQPYVVAYMTEQLDVEPRQRVLEIGAGSGYQAAILSRLAREVVSVERYRTLADAARERLKTLGYANVAIIAGDGFAGMPERAPFDRIIVTAAAEEVPTVLIEQLLRQIDEAGLQGEHVRGDLLQIAFGGDLAAHLQDARHQIAQFRGGEEMLLPQFRGGRPLLVGGREQILILIGDGFVW